MKKELGDFTIFGFTKKPEQLLQQEMLQRLDIEPKIINFGNTGCLFYHTSYGEIAESETNILIKLGFLRSYAHGDLSAQQVIEHKLMSFDFVEENKLHGNALIACLSKTEPIFSVYKTLLAVPQLYYSLCAEEIICSDRMRAITWTLDDLKLNENILPMHFLFRTTIGTSTYFHNIERMLSGYFMKWKNGNVHLRMVQDLQFCDTDSIRNINAETLNILYKGLNLVVADYSHQVQHNGYGIGNLLSGGVDSSLIQSILNEQSKESVHQTFSFVPKASSFLFEFDYAKKASEHFHTDHTFVHFTEHDYPDLLKKTIRNLAFPPLLPSEPGLYAVARHAKDMNIQLRFFMSGQAAEPIFGYPIGKKIKLAQSLSHIPGIAPLIISLGKLLLPLHPYGEVLMLRGKKLKVINDSESFLSPMNTMAVYLDINRAVNCFGEKQIKDTLEHRRDLACQYRKSQHYLEKVFLIDLVTDSYDVASERHQLFLSNFKEIIHPFLDDEILRIGFQFHPDIRYIYKSKEKYLLKALLYQKTGLTTTWKQKGAAQFFEDFYEWMRIGSLRPLVDDIRLPGFMNRNDFEELVQKPDVFLWSILTLDLFLKEVVTAHRNRVHEAVRA